MSSRPPKSDFYLAKPELNNHHIKVFKTVQLYSIGTFTFIFMSKSAQEVTDEPKVTYSVHV